MGRKNVAIRNLLLRTLAGAGLVSIVLIAPQMTRLLKKLDRPAKNRQQLYRRISQGLARLEAAGLVRIEGEYGKRKVRITDDGRNVVEQIALREYEIEEPAFWDGKWRVLVFDIKEQRRRTRTQLRRILQGAGFFRLQDSVWVYPYPCDDFLSLVRAHLHSGVGELRYFEADALESDRALREYFRLRT